ncbi:MAG: TolC family protein [Magnetococcales bacterium]|nr:TolC family protein [Magnetococcales bacterium]
METPEHSDLKENIWRWIEDRPEIWAARARMKESLMSEDMERAAHLPTVDFNYTASHSWDKEFGSIASPYSGKENSHTVQLVLNVPIFKGMETVSRTREAVAMKEASMTDLDRLRNLAKREVEEARYDLKNHKNAIADLEQALSFSEKATAGMEESFRAKIRTLTDVLNAQYEVHTLRTNLVRHRYQAQLALIRLWKALGRFISPSSPSRPDLHEESVKVAEAGRDEVTKAASQRLKQAIAEVKANPTKDSQKIEEGLQARLNVLEQSQPAPLIADQIRPLKELTDKDWSKRDPAQSASSVLLANKTQNALPKPFPLILDEGWFMVHVGTFVDADLLGNRVRNLADVGIPSWSEKIKSPDDKILTRVLVGPFSSQAELLEAMSMINKRTGKDVGWIPIAGIAARISVSTKEGNQDGVVLRSNREGE